MANDEIFKNIVGGGGTGHEHKAHDFLIDRRLIRPTHLNAVWISHDGQRLQSNVAPPILGSSSGEKTIIILERSDASTDDAPHFTGFTHHFTAPNESAFTVFFSGHRFSAKPSSTTQELATIDARRSVVAFPAFGTQTTCFSIRHTKVGRFLRIDEVFLTRRFNSRPFWNDGLAIVSWNHFGGTVESILQTIAHVPKVGHFSPTGLHGAGSRQSMTPTYCTHVIFDGLK